VRALGNPSNNVYHDDKLMFLEVLCHEILALHSVANTRSLSKLTCVFFDLSQISEAHVLTLVAEPDLTSCTDWAILSV